MIREPMTPSEFDRECRLFERRNPGASLTSGRRTEKRNEQVGGSPGSKHVLGMARDYSFETTEEIDAAIVDAGRRGFWFKPYKWGIHLQGLPPGTVPEWWLSKYEGG